jgi:hypothetical protein
MTNDEYLRSLANDSPERLSEYLRAEHVDGAPLEVTLTVRGEPGEVAELIREVWHSAL